MVAELPSAEPFVADLTDTDAILRAASQIEQLDVLVLSAGVMEHGPLEQLDDAAWRRMMEVNLFAPVTLTLSLIHI